MKKQLCIWNCGRMTERRCGICIFCIDERDERDRQIDAGKVAYIPPTERPGHRFYERKQLSEAQKAAIVKANAAKKAQMARPNAQLGGDRPEKGVL